MNSRFQRESRVLKAEDFSSAFRQRPKKRTAHFTLYIRDNGAPHARLGLVVAKRFAPRAVTRNTIRRICKEVFRQTQLPDGDYIVRLLGTVVAKSEPATDSSLKRQLKNELTELFSQQSNGRQNPGPGRKQA